METPKHRPANTEATPTPEFPQEERLYAWRKLAGYLTFTLLDQDFREKSDITIVDSCSAFPVYAEMTRAYLLQKVTDKGEKIIGQFFEHSQNRAYVQQLLTPDELAKLDEISGFVNPEGSENELSAFKNIRSSIIPNKGSDFRRLVSSAIAELIHRPSDDLPAEADIEASLREAHSYYRVEDQQVQAADARHNPDVEKKPVRIRTVFKIDAGVTPDAEVDTYLRDLRGQSDEIAQAYRADVKDLFFKLLSRAVIQELQSYHRNWRVVSLDMAEPEKIKKQVRKSFSQDTLRSNLFQRSARMGEVGSHVRADAYKLPFKPESIDFFTSIEGWPFYHTEPGADKAAWLAREAATARDVYEALSPGGTALFFPFQSFDGENEHLQTVLQQWQALGATIEYGDVSRDKILEMADKDENPRLTAHSPIFGDAEQQNFKTLIVRKPHLEANSSS